MRVLVAGFQHETNTFALTPADWAAFGRGDFFPPFVRGHDLVERLRGAGLPASGFLRKAEHADWDVVPSCWAGASPSGRVTRDAFERIGNVMSEDLGRALAAGPLDGVYLDLHGAAVCEHLDDPETELMRRVRALTGSEVPLVASLDLHANVDRAMLEVADHLVAYRTYPHVDMVETGEAAFDLLERRIRTGARARFAMRRLPFLLPIVAQATLHDPAASAYRLLDALEGRHGGSASFAPGFPAADVPRCGAALWAYGVEAEAVVDRLHDEIVRTRAAWRPRLLTTRAAVKEALRLAGDATGPVMVADVQDNPGAGVDGNTTGLLHALLRAGAGRRWPGRIAVGLVHDPSAAALATRVGIGKSIEVRLGASVSTWTGTMSEPPVVAEARVRAISDGRVVLAGPMMTGARVDAGPSACLEVDGILVAVSTGRTQMLERSLFRMVGIEPERMKVVVVKSAVHFRADFDAVAGGCLLAKAPGPMAGDPADLPWTRLPAGVSPAA